MDCLAVAESACESAGGTYSHERRQALITGAVTGELSIPGVAV